MALHPSGRRCMRTIGPCVRACWQCSMRDVHVPDWPCSMNITVAVAGFAQAALALLIQEAKPVAKSRPKAPSRPALPTPRPREELKMVGAWASGR